MSKGKSEKQDIKVSGIINSLDWDDEGNLISIELSTEDEDYEVEPNAMGKELFDLIGEEVEVVGTVTKRRGENDRIKIIKYEVLDYDYDEDDDDDDDHYFDNDD